MMADLDQAMAGDVVLLHGCCHNPTGANLTKEQWRELTELFLRKRLLPFVDIAYQGFGDGLDEDAWGVRHLVSNLPETLIAASCSKNFGIYRERTGILIATNPDPQQGKVITGNLAMLNRVTYSFPPDHGARLVSTVLNDPALRREWQTELNGIRNTLVTSREALAQSLRELTNTDNFDYLARHRGMFSRINLEPEQVMTLRDHHGVYVVGDGRMNVAGLNEQNIPAVARAIHSVTK